MKAFHRTLALFFERPESFRYHDVEKLLISVGFNKVEAKGSHKKFKHAFLQHSLIIPVHSNECKNFYKKLALKAIQEVLSYN